MDNKLVIYLSYVYIIILNLDQFSEIYYKNYFQRVKCKMKIPLYKKTLNNSNNKNNIQRKDPHKKLQLLVVVVVLNRHLIIVYIDIQITHIIKDLP